MWDWVGRIGSLVFEALDKDWGKGTGTPTGSPPRVTAAGVAAFAAVPGGAGAGDDAAACASSADDDGDDGDDAAASASDARALCLSLARSLAS